MKHFCIILIAIIFLIGCGRTENGYILNNTNDTLKIVIKLNYPPTEHQPEEYFRNSIINREKSSIEDWKLVGDCVTDFDQDENIATLKLLPKERIRLGTVRVGLTRDNYKTWEFTEIKISGSSFNIEAKDNGIMTFIRKDKSWFSQDSHYFIIGRE
jgi:hypothetical protein